MRISTLSAFVFASFLATAACARDKPAATVPAAPEFADPATLPARPDDAASPGTARIAPEDQLFFANDSAVLQPDVLGLLDNVATWVKANPERTILVQGHADASGTADHNRDLSARRAEAVALYLREHGVPSSRITLVAEGEHAASLVPHGANRRVVIFATTIEQAAATK